MGLTPKRRVHQRFARGAEIALITIGTVTLLVPGVGAQQQPANNVADCRRRTDDARPAACGIGPKSRPSSSKIRV